MINDLFGINIPLPIQTFGFFMVLSFIFGGLIISLELKRKQKEGLLSPITKKLRIGEGMSLLEIISSSLSGFIIGFKLVAILDAETYNMFVENPQSFILSTKGSLIGGVVFALISVYYKWKQKEKQKLENPKWIDKKINPYELTGNMIMIAAISGIIGAKIFANLENWEEFIHNPWGELLSFSGLTFYGGLIFGAISVIYYARKHNIPIQHLIDSFAPALILAYGIGRIGCQLSGDGDWGIFNSAYVVDNYGVIREAMSGEFESVKQEFATYFKEKFPDGVPEIAFLKPEILSFLPDWMFAYDYPHNVIRDGVTLQNCNSTHCNHLPSPVYPTPIYEIIMTSFIFIFLWLIRKRIKIGGLIFCIYLILNGIERFIIEKIRVNIEYNMLGGITQAEIISLCLIITGIIGYYLLYKRTTKKS